MLFWADSQSLADYENFGNILIFDSMYRTNVYKKPLLILARVINHFLTCIFPCALLTDEIVESYEWLLSTFNQAASDKKPYFVLKDGDKAMRKVIKEVIPYTRHRLCSRHFQRNVVINVHCKKFVERFIGCIRKKVPHNNLTKIGRL